jgi:hypothetical protein
MNKLFSKKLVAITLILVVIATLALGGFYFFFKPSLGADAAQYELTAAKEAKLVKDGLYGRVNAYVAKLYGNGIASEKCYYITIGIKEAATIYCVEVAHIQKVENLVYVALTGEKFYEDLSPANAHIDTGVMQFLILDDQEKELKPISAGPFEFTGTYGSANTNIKLVSIANDGAMAWVTTFGDMHQGYSGGGVELYAPLNNSVKSILGLVTNSDNEGACNDEASCEITITNASAFLVPNKSKTFYPIQVEVNQSTHIGKSLKENKTKFTLNYSEKNSSYIIPKGYQEQFSEF